MEPLTWTGAMGAFINPIFYITILAFLAFVVAQVVLSFAMPEGRPTVNEDGTIAARGGLPGTVNKGVMWSLYAVIGTIVLYIAAGVVGGWQLGGIIGGISRQMTPVWIALIVTFALSLAYKRKLGLYGKLFDSPVGMIGFGLVMFWVFTAIFGAGLDWITTHDPLCRYLV